MRFTVAFQGERGAFSEQAAHQLLGVEVRLLPCRSFEDAFHAVRQGEVGACVVPIENTLTGSIHKNFDLLLEHTLTIVGETRVRVEHHLIALKGTRFRDVKRVISHPVALGQCQKFLRAHPKLQTEAAYDTAGSVKWIAAQKSRTTAAIAGALAAEAYGGAILKRNIEDHSENYTRFWLLCRPTRGHPGVKKFLQREVPPDKTSLVFSTKNLPGALFKCLGVFADRNINLTKIESRPVVGRPFEYFFYVDFWGNVAEESCRAALRDLKTRTDFLRVLGCYPSA